MFIHVTYLNMIDIIDKQKSFPLRNACGGECYRNEMLNRCILTKRGQNLTIQLETMDLQNLIESELLKMSKYLLIFIIEKKINTLNLVTFHILLF